VTPAIAVVVPKGAIKRWHQGIRSGEIHQQHGERRAEGIKERKAKIIGVEMASADGEMNSWAWWRGEEEIINTEEEHRRRRRKAYISKRRKRRGWRSINGIGKGVGGV